MLRFAAVPYYCVLRLPVVSPALNAQEAAMMEMLRQVELEDSMLSDHEVRHKSVFYATFRTFSSCLKNHQMTIFRIIFFSMYQVIICVK
jgi:hypothetical protein